MDDLEFDLEHDGFEITFEPSPDFFLSTSNEEDLKKLNELIEEFIVEENYEEAQRIKDRIDNKE